MCLFNLYIKHTFSCHLTLTIYTTIFWPFGRENDFIIAYKLGALYTMIPFMSQDFFVREFIQSYQMHAMYETPADYF